MLVLAEAAVGEIEALLGELGPAQACEDLRKPETGLVMVRGCIGGDGAAFNLGEATVSRSVVRLATGEVGFGYVLGHDPTKARLIAYCDALMQRGGHRDELQRVVLAPIAARLAAARQLRAEQASATKVEFFTLVRGEDQA
jgi:alpha-D-ribose 1-methylphosphonate 5-triphosphate synthase subunit PhnG